MARKRLRWHCGLWTYGKPEIQVSDTLEASSQHQGQFKKMQSQGEELIVGVVDEKGETRREGDCCVVLCSAEGEARRWDHHCDCHSKQKQALARMSKKKAPPTRLDRVNLSTFPSTTTPYIALKFIVTRSPSGN